jgi:glycine/D-amino acid oxidase-like deaminating enzyme
MIHTFVLIIGAGPTGLSFALWLTKLGVKVRIVDKIAEPGTTIAGFGVPLQVFDWRSEHELAGFARNALHLLRTDSYVALADPSGSYRFWSDTVRSSRRTSDTMLDVGPFREGTFEAERLPLRLLQSSNQRPRRLSSNQSKPWSRLRGQL